MTKDLENIFEAVVQDINELMNAPVITLGRTRQTKHAIGLKRSTTHPNRLALVFATERVPTEDSDLLPRQVIDRAITKRVGFLRKQGDVIGLGSHVEGLLGSGLSNPELHKKLSKLTYTGSPLGKLMGNFLDTMPKNSAGQVIDLKYASDTDVAQHAPHVRRLKQHLSRLSSIKSGIALLSNQGLTPEGSLNTSEFDPNRERRENIKATLADQEHDDLGLGKGHTEDAFGLLNQDQIEPSIFGNAYRRAFSGKYGSTLGTSDATKKLKALGHLRGHVKDAEDIETTRYNSELARLNAGFKAKQEYLSSPEVVAYRQETERRALEKVNNRRVQRVPQGVTPPPLPPPLPKPPALPPPPPRTATASSVEASAKANEKPAPVSFIDPAIGASMSAATPTKAAAPAVEATTATEGPTATPDATVPTERVISQVRKKAAVPRGPNGKFLRRKPKEEVKEDTSSLSFSQIADILNKQ